MFKTFPEKPVVFFVGLQIFGILTGLAAEKSPEPFADSAFPNKDFALHGGPEIGSQSVGSATILDGLIGNHSGIHLSLWATGSMNVSNEQTSGGNLPSGYVIDPNTYDLTEAVFRIVKYADTVQKDHWDWGMKIDTLYGKNYYMFLSNKLFSGQLINTNNPKKYGYDIPQFYVDLFDPNVAGGINFRVGRILTNPTVYFGRNQLFTHTVFDNNTGDTETGVVSTTKVAPNVTIQVGAVNTADVAVWDKANRKLSGFGGLEWTSPSQSDSIYLVAYGVNNGAYAYHNWQTLYAIWTHKFSKDVFNRFQSAYFYEKDVPVFGQNANAQGTGLGFAIRNPSANGISATQQIANINGYSFVDTLGYSFTDKDYAIGRLEFTSDPEGSLTGTPANYLGWTIGIGHNFTPWLTGTAEVRHDKSIHAAAFDNGAQFDLDLFATSLTVHI